MKIRIRKKGAKTAWMTKRAMCCMMTGSYGPWYGSPDKK